MSRSNIKESLEVLIQRRLVSLLAASIVLGFALCSSSAWAQSMEPRAYSNTPVGMSFLLVGYD